MCLRSSTIRIFTQSFPKNLIGFKYNDEIYYYEKNGQNDIIGLLDEQYNLITKYYYDAYGRVIEIVGNEDIGEANPFRYRSYYFDQETNLYYLNTRYYNPIWGRFVNADGIIGANGDHVGYNLYAYVSNNPVNNVDENGSFLRAIGNWVNKKIIEPVKNILNPKPKASSKPKNGDVCPPVAKNSKANKLTSISKTITKSVFPKLGMVADMVDAAAKTIAKKTNRNITIGVGVSVGIKGTPLSGSLEYGTTHTPGISKDYFTAGAGVYYGLSFPITPYIVLGNEKATKNTTSKTGTAPYAMCGIGAYVKYPFDPNTIMISPGATCEAGMGYTWEWDRK